MTDSFEQAAEVENALNELKSKGIECAIIRKDGILIYSTLNLDESAPNVIASMANVTNELMRKNSDVQKEIEVSIDGVYFVVIPIKDYFLCSVVKERDAKKIVRDIVAKIKF